MGFGLAPIPWTVIRDYAQYQGLPADEIEDFVYLIRKMDEVYLAYHSPKKEPKKGGKIGGGK